MADILIRGMEKPESCDKCKLCALIPVGMYGLQRKCMPLNRNAQITVRRKDCPLQELPEHGDLIDRDALMADGWRLYKGAIMQDGSYATYEMPLSNPGVIVVIPSNKEEIE